MRYTVDSMAFMNNTPDTSRIRHQAWLALILVLTAAIAGPANCAVTVDFSCWAPDRGTPYKWFEGAKEIQTYFTTDYRAAGNLYVYVRNSGKNPVVATSIRMNGQDLEALRKDNSVVWWRMLPNPIPGGGVGEVIIRPRQALDPTATIAITFDDGSVADAEVSPDPCPVRIETVGFNAGMDRVFLVVERLTARPQRLTRLLFQMV